MSVDERIVELLSEWGARRAHGEETSPEDLCQDAPELVETLRLALRQRPSGSGNHGAEGTTPRNGPEDGREMVDPGVGPTTFGFVEGPDTLPDHEELGQLGPYRVLRLLGAGGMGAVFQAVDDTLGRQVALKVLRPSLAHDERAQQRFLREARAAAALEHDHIVTIFQVGEDRGIPFLAMPLLSGMSLETRLGREGRLPVPEVLRIGREIAEGLDAAHGRKVIHRDIKPANIWLEGGRGRVKILDFGLARATDDAQRLTQDDAILGTPAYMAPEQAVGSRQVDARLDLFSLGAVLYRTATGRVPFAARGALQTLVALVQSAPAPPRELNPEIPEALNDLILKLLEKDPADRPDTARAVVEAIEAIENPDEDHLPLIRLDHTEPSRPVAQPARTRHLGRIVAVAASLVLLVLAAFALPLLVGMFEDKGRLTIETPLPYVLVVVRQSGQQVAIIDPERQTTVALWPGAYDLSLEGEHQGLMLADDRITIRRGDRKVIKVIPRAEPKVGEPAFVDPSSIAQADLPGLISRPATVEGRGRWQVETRRPREVVRSLAWSPDRRRLACVAEHERAIRIYDAERFELIGLLVGHTAPVLSVAWSPDGRQLATTSLDGTLRLWSNDGVPGRVLKGHGPDGGPLCVAWSPTGQWLATGGTGRDIRIFNRNGAPGPWLEGHGGSITSLSWSPDGRRLVAGTSQGRVHVWDADGTRGPVLGRDQHPVLAVSWSADGHLIAAGGQDGARIWTSEGAPGPTLEDAPSGIACLAWSPRTPTLAAACSDGTVRLWNAEGQPGPIMSVSPSSGTATGPGPDRGQGSSGAITLAWSPDGAHLASAGQDGGVRLWDADGTLVAALNAPLCPFRSLAWGPDGKRLVSDSPLDHCVRIWDVDQARGPVLEGNEATVNAVAWSRDGRWIAAGDSDRTVRLWSADGTPGRVIREVGGKITSIAWNPDSLQLAAGCYNNTIHLLRNHEAPDVVLNGHKAHVLCVAWSPDGRRLASGGYDCTVRVWVAADRTSTVLGKLGQRINALSWSPDGKRLASASHDGLLRIWDGVGDETSTAVNAHGSASPRVLKGHVGAVHDVCWSPDGLRLASGGDGGTIRLWSTDGVPGPVLDNNGAPVNALAFSPDGRRLAAAGEDGTLRIWDVATLEMERVVVPTAPDKVTVLDRKGQVIHATGGAGGDLVVYQVSSLGSATLLNLPELYAKPASKTSRARVKAKTKAKSKTKAPPVTP